jgi:hypothetical protein
MPWDDAVTLALTYAEIPYEIVYDEEVLRGELPKYDWLICNHEDFTGQYEGSMLRFIPLPGYQEDQRNPGKPWRRNLATRKFPK